DYFRKWAKDVGPHALMVVSAILSAHKVEKQGYRTCTSLMKLADKYSYLQNPTGEQVFLLPMFVGKSSNG
ncbi:MAG: hypothetical protein Q8N20_03825, partial [Eubacteriales bacterium]|nr:hypothetical protein [Eubacteriales bacterium]